MLIILEGPDCAGKSTLARSLQERIGDAEIWHKGRPENHPLIEYETPLFGYRPNNGRHIICDRWHIGEWVYPQVKGRQTKADDAVWAHIELFLRARGALSVLVSPSVETMKRRMRERGDDYVDETELAEISRIFNDRFTRVLTAYDYADSPTRIVKVARQVESSFVIQHNGSYVGSPRPNLLLVGERRMFAAPYPPSFGPFPATSGHYLLTCLTLDGVPLNSFGMANAYEEDLASLWRQLEGPKTVALGRRAQHELTKANVPHGAVPHPQYVRRFHHARFRWYENLIFRAAHQREDLIKCRP